MAREILYKRPVVAAKAETVTKKPSKTGWVVPNVTQKPTHEAVQKWLQTHPLFKVGGMCTQLGLDRPNFCKLFLNAKEPRIKEEVLTAVVAVIRQYGFIG